MDSSLPARKLPLSSSWKRLPCPTLLAMAYLTNILVVNLIVGTHAMADSWSRHTEATPSAQSSATRRPPPPWSYNWERFPAFWFGMNMSGMESSAQAHMDARFSLVIVGGFHNLLNASTSSRNEERSMADQCARIRAINSSVACFVYRQAWWALSNFEMSRAAAADPNTSPWWWVTDDGGHVINHTLPGRASSVWALRHDWQNDTAQRFYLREVIGELLSEHPFVQGAYFDDFDGEGCLGALNETMPSHYTKKILLSMYKSRLQLFREVALTMNNVGMLPIFAMASKFNVTDNGCLLPEQDVLAALDDVGFVREAVFSRAVQTSPALCSQFMLNALTEAELQIPTLFWTPVEANGSLPPLSLPAFLIIRRSYSYFGASSGWTDKDFSWHREYDQQYGQPIDFAQVMDGGMRFQRQYRQCFVSLDCRSLTGRISFHCRDNCSRLADDSNTSDREEP